MAELTRGGRDRIGLGLNCVGGRSAAALARCLAEGGTLVSYGNMSRKAVHLPLGALIFRDVRLVGFWLSRWNGADPTGRRHMIDDILALVRAGRFRDAPVDEVRWEWDTPEAALRDAAQNGLGGFRKGKGLFLFGDT
ncbi:hypothetical protein CDD83_10698 [Cordyceps sp. RAO-2017]|nr:hypothetical protein CDD83_10698 [Cordyceps sp. RAO-2017]